MISNFLWPELEDMDVDDMWFQQDGATCHTANETMALLRDKFNGRVISRGNDVNWPPRSCDLTPMDFFLWAYLKENSPKASNNSRAKGRDNILIFCSRHN